MSIRDVDHWVSEVVAHITPVRPYLTPDKRALQTANLHDLGTRTITYNSQEPTISDKRGRVLQELVLSAPDYEGRQMSAEEQVVADYFLAFLRTRSPFFSDYPKLAFHNPDGILISIEAKTAWVVGLVEIKHSGPNREVERQLRNIVRDIEFLVALMNRNITILQNTVGKKPELPAVEGITWPKQIRTIKIARECRRIVYFPDGAEVESSVYGWETRNSEFSTDEITRIASKYWTDLVAKGGATAVATTEEEPEMAVHHSPSVKSVVVRTHEEREAEVTVQTTETKECQNTLPSGEPCLKPIPKDRPPYYIDRENQVEGCDSCATNNANQQILSVVEHIKEVVEKARAADPKWDPSEVGKKAQDKLSEIRQQHLPARNYTLSVSAARDVRAEVDFEATTCFVGAAKEAVGAFPDNGYAQRFLAEASELEVELRRLKGSAPREKRGGSFKLVGRAEELYEASLAVEEIDANLEQIDKFIADAQHAVGPFAETPPGRSVLSKIDNLVANRQNFDNPSVAHAQRSPLVESRTLINGARTLVAEASNVEQTVSRSKEIDAIASEGSWDLGFGPQQDEVQPATLGDVATLAGVAEQMKAIGANGDGKVCPNPDCVQYGGPIAPERKRCDECGTLATVPVPAAIVEPQERVCPNCKTPAQPGRKRCDECGCELPKEEAVVEPEDGSVAAELPPEVVEAARKAAAASAPAPGPKTKSVRVTGRPTPSPAPAPEPAPTPAPVPTTSPAPAQPARDFIYCTAGCGYKNALTAKACANCGETIVVIKQ